jgi:hypothetical protein
VTVIPEAAACLASGHSRLSSQCADWSGGGLRIRFLSIFCAFFRLPKRFNTIAIIEHNWYFAQKQKPFENTLQVAQKVAQICFPKNLLKTWI